MAPKTAGKSQSDHVKAFNLLVASYRARPSDKLLSELDKMLAVLAKISDTSVFQAGQKEGFSFLLHCQQLLGVLEVGLHWKRLLYNVWILSDCQSSTPDNTTGAE